MKCSAEQLDAVKQDSNYHDLGTLPSQGLPYPSDERSLYIKPFKLAELKLLSRAVELNEMQHLLRAVDNVITAPVANLTIGDFFYVLLWLRLYSMPKSPYIVEWKCQHPYFVHKETRLPLLYNMPEWPSMDVLEKEYENSPCDTENTGVVHQSDVKILSLDETFQLGAEFDFPRMHCYEGRAKALKDPDLSMLAPAIQWMRGLTWEEKMEYADANPHLIGEALDLNRRITHGISETITFSCRKCRMEHTNTMALNALSFFQ